MMISLQRSILETVVYFDLFDYPLTLVELYRYLWRPPASVSITDVEEAVAGLPQLRNYEGVIVLRDRETLGEVREERYLESENKFRKRRCYLWLLSCLPGVEAIWIVNSMAYHNVRPESDIDLLIVARPGKIWSTRFFTTAVAKLLRLRPTPTQRKDALCLSFYLTSATLNLSVLASPEHERYESYWLAQIMPVYDPKNLLARCWDENEWARRNLPYSNPMSLHYNRSIPHGWCQCLSHAFGRLLLTEPLWRKLQLWILPSRLRKLSGPPEEAVVILRDSILKFHTIDPRPTIQARFEQELTGVLSAKF